VLLIDDIFGELDLPRRNALVAAPAGGRAKFVTATNLAARHGAGGARRIEGVVHAA
jgi:recombinational DNA repair ATPase RecF